MSPSNHHPIRYYNTDIYKGKEYKNCKNILIICKKMLDICLDLLYNYKLHN